MVDKKKLKIYRELNNYTVKTLANKLHIRKKIVQEWEKGTIEVDEDNLNKLAKLYDIKVSDLLIKQHNSLWYFLTILASVLISVIIYTIYTDIAVLITNIICLIVLFIFVIKLKNNISIDEDKPKSLFNINLPDKVSKRIKLYIKESIVLGTIYILITNIFKVLELDILVINFFILPIRSVNDLVISIITYLLITFLTFIIELVFGEYIYKKGVSNGRE